jgi:hypothetical protein
LHLLKAEQVGAPDVAKRRATPVSTMLGHQGGVLMFDKYISVNRHVLGCTSKGLGKDLLEELEHLRDELAHAQDIITGRWPRLVELAKTAEQILAACEVLKPEPTS